MSEPIRSRTPIEVRYAETDQMGVVHHASYLIWLELARTALCRETGYDYIEIEAMGCLLVVSGVEMRYKAAVRYGDPVEVVCWVNRLRGRAIDFQYEIWNGDVLAITGSTKHIWTDRETHRARRLPETVRAGFRRVAGIDDPESPQTPATEPSHGAS